MADDPILDGIATHTFRLVRKGFDPEEVRSFLVQIAAAVERRAPVDPSAPALGAVAPEAFGGAVEEARAELARLRSEQAALRAWFGQEGRPDAVLVPKPVRDASATADTILRAAEARAAEIRAGAETEAAQRLRAAPEGAATPTTQSWDDVGGSVARILAGAEQEAIAIRAQAEESVSGAKAEAERVEAEATETLTQARTQADDVVRAAEARAAQVESSAEEGAWTHVAEVLARAEADLDRTRRELDQAHAQLEEIHGLVGRSLAQRGPRPTFADPAEVVKAAPAPEAAPAVAPPDPAAVTVVAPPLAAPPLAPPATAPVGPGVVPAAPSPAAADPATPWAAPTPPPSDAGDVAAAPIPSALAAAGLDAAPGGAPPAEPAERSVRTVLAGTGVPSEDEAAWSPLRTFRARLGAEAADGESPLEGAGASAPATPEGVADRHDDELRAPGWLTPPSPPSPPPGV